MPDDQFTRLRLLIGAEGIEKLRESFVIVAGAGAVGGYAIEALARAGIGRLRIIDNDTVDITNINRQILALHSTVGKPKAALAAERVRDINPACAVDPVAAFIREDNLPALLDGKPDFVIDAIDSLNPKTALIAYLRQNDIPFASAMGAALRTDPFQIRFGKMSDVHHCRLAYMLRKRLRRRGVPLDFDCVYSTESREHIPDPVYADDAADHPDGQGRARVVMGSMPTITGIFGLILANIAIQKLSGQPLP